MMSSSLPDAAEIEASADEFRKQYASGTMGPLNIELLIEKQLGIQIIPVPGLCKNTRNKGFASHSGKTIGVDASIMRGQPEQYRQVLGHELAHVQLHRDLLPAASFQTLEDARYWHDNLPDGKRACIEYEADQWAGRVLMPRRQLEVVFRQAIVDAGVLFIDVPILKGPARREMWEIFRGVVAQLVGQRFGITETWAAARIREDGLWKSTKLETAIELAKAANGRRRPPCSH